MKRFTKNMNVKNSIKVKFYIKSLVCLKYFGNKINPVKMVISILTLLANFILNKF